MQKWKSYKETKKERQPEVAFPTSTAHYVEIRTVAEDGIFYHGNKSYSKSYLFSENNYPLYSEDDQEHILELLAKFYNSLRIDIELSIINLLNPDRIPEEINYQNEIEEDIGNIIATRQQRVDRVSTCNCLTLTLLAEDIDAARNRFIQVEMTIIGYFDQMGSKLYAMNLTERMELLYRIQNPGSYPKMFTNLNKKYVKETLAVKSFGYEKNRIRMITDTGTWYTRLLYIKEFPDMLDDDFLTLLSLLQLPMTISIHVRGIEKTVAKQLLEDQLLRVQRGINKEQDRNNQAGHYHSEISRNRQEEQRELNSMLDDLKRESLFVASFTICIYGRSLEDLDKAEEEIKNITMEKTIEVAEHEVKLREAYITSLPLGLRMVRTLRPMFSSALSALNPFGASDLLQEEGFYYGVNFLTRRPIMLNRKTINPPHGVIVGKSGSGKSLFNKMEKTQVYLNTTDQMIIVDPMSEYRNWVDHLEDGIFYQCGVDGALRFNPLAANQADKKTIEKKSLLINAMVSVILKNEFRAAHQDVIDKAIRSLYETEWCKKNLKTLKEKVQEFAKAGNLAADTVLIALDRLTDGALDLFSEEEEINYKYNRVTVFGLGNRATGNEDQIVITMIAILDYIVDRITENHKNHITTWVDVDEIQRILPLAQAAEMFRDFWQTTRKLQTICTALTTTVRNLATTAAGKDIISSTGYKAIFRLEKTDRQDAAAEFDLSESHLNYVRSAEEGSAILRVDNMFYKMESKLTQEEKKSKLYRIISTNPYDQ